MRNHPYGFEIYLVNVKTMRMIALVLVAFLENLNFRGLGITVIEKKEKFFTIWMSPLKL